MSGVMDLIEVVAQAVETRAAGVVSITLARADGGLLPVWAPGAHIDVCVGKDLVRQYSLCGAPGGRESYRIGVLREPASRGGSAALHEQLKPGDALRIHAPRNNFPLPEAAEYVFVAGGIGITPFLPMLAVLEQRGANWKLLYGGRSRASMAFLDELAVYGARVKVQPEDEQGLLDIAAWVGAPRPDCAVLCCGPERLLAAVEKHCATWPEEALLVERFRAAPQAEHAPDHEFEVVLAKTGITVTVPAGVTIADALEEQGVYIPRSCNEGTCGTCVTKVLEGVPDHRDSFLRGKARTENKRITVCCSRSQTPRLVLDV